MLVLTADSESGRCGVALCDSNGYRAIGTNEGATCGDVVGLRSVSVHILNSKKNGDAYLTSRVP